YVRGFEVRLERVPECRRLHGDSGPVEPPRAGRRALGLGALRSEPPGLCLVDAAGRELAEVVDHARRGSIRADAELRGHGAGQRVLRVRAMMYEGLDDDLLDALVLRAAQLE